MIKYIGDLSQQDAEVLKEYALKSEKILEFGSGGSTQILSYYAKNKITSIDTSSEWMEKTQANLDLLKITNEPDYYLYDQFKPKEYDFIFDDGIFKLRREFAVNIWPNLKIGGVIAFHDTRRIDDVKNVSFLIETYFTEIGKVIFNYNHSNITIIEKKESEPYINWQL